MALLARTASGVSNYGCRARTQQGAPCESLYNHAHDIQYRFWLGPLYWVVIGAGREVWVDNMGLLSLRSS